MKEKLNEAQLDCVSGGVAVDEYDAADILDEYDEEGESSKPERLQSTKAPNFRAAPSRRQPSEAAAINGHKIV